tara:strand:+ start:85 stop:549 length:465 start_codon:yes stop_codon:yes gene_type:complete
MSKWIEGYEDLYKIYPNGDVESYKRKNPRILKHCIDSRGYKHINLYKNSKKNFRIHRLLAIHFIENPNNYPVVDHIDRNQLNNNLENLRWVTQSINCRNRKNKGKCMKGVTKRGNKFEAGIRIDGKIIYLGRFDTEIEAHQAYMVEYNKIMNLH